MSVYIISDLHLSSERSELLQMFSSFVSSLKNGDHLYILGDLFNFFVGLDPEDKAQSLVREVLKTAADRDIRCFFIRGNRDFIMNTSEAAYLNMELLDDIVLREYNGVRLILTHGDLFCTNDREYMRYRRIVGNPFIQMLFRCLPLSARRRIAGKLRDKSINNDRENKGGRAVFGIADESVEEYAVSLVGRNIRDKQSAPIVICGHIHEFSEVRSEGIIRCRYVLGAWGAKYSWFKINIDAENTVPLIEFAEKAFP